MGGREVLEFVDEKVPRELLIVRAHVRLAKQQFDGAIDLLVEVEQSPLGKDRPVVLEGAADAGGVGYLGLDVVRICQAEPDGRSTSRYGTQGSVFICRRTVTSDSRMRLTSFSSMTRRGAPPLFAKGPAPLTTARPRELSVRMWAGSPLVLCLSSSAARRLNATAVTLDGVTPRSASR